MANEYYLISDLHIGGDATLDECEFESELTAFLMDLEQKDGQIELIVPGDMFGLWELTDREGVDKLRCVVDSHPELFEQFRRTGRTVRITLLPGNHDHELACDPGFGRLLADYNIHLEPREHIVRAVGERKIWIEHGHQRDPFNRIAEFGNAHATPFGYYVTRQLVSNAGKYAVFAQQQWLRDLESVQPNENVPHWLLSNYFYREMSPLLRYVLVPFLVLFGLSGIVLGGLLLEKTGLLPMRLFHGLLHLDLGVFGKLVGLVVTVNAAVIVLLILVSIPLWFVRRDVTRTLRRYGVGSTRDLAPKKREAYRAAAGELFEHDPSFAVFVYGHTHDAFVERVGDGLLVNTGTWLKKLTRVRSRFHLPDVYYPTFELSCFRIAADGDSVTVRYEGQAVPFDPALTLVQRLSVIGRTRPHRAAIPPVTRV